MAVVRRSPAPAPFVAWVGDLDSTREAMRQAGVEGVPVDVLRAAAALGVRVQFEPMTDEMSGYLERRDGQWVIGVNAHHSGVRQRFTIAHELGHFVLHRKEQQEFRDVIFTRRTIGRDNMEREADAFAAQLLMPEESVIRDVRGGLTNVHALAERYNVSSLAMKYRLISLGYRVS